MSSSSSVVLEGQGRAAAMKSVSMLAPMALTLAIVHLLQIKLPKLPKVQSNSEGIALLQFFLQILQMHRVAACRPCCKAS